MTVIFFFQSVGGRGGGGGGGVKEGDPDTRTHVPTDGLTGVLP